MSLYIAFTGQPKAKVPDGKLETYILDCIKYSEENKDGIGDDDLDDQTYLVFNEDDSRFSRIIREVAERKKYKTVSFYPVDFSKRHPICWSDHRIGYDTGDRVRKFFENADICFNFGKPTNLFRQAEKYNCIASIVDLSIKAEKDKK